jgi:hypothetical protein
LLDEVPLEPGVELDAEFVTDEEEFERWLSETTRVDRFFVSVRPPNPTYDPRSDAVEKLVEESNADRISVEAVADKDGPSLDINGSDLAAFAFHAASGYGEMRGSGERDGQPTEFDSKSSIRSTAIEYATTDTEQTIFQKLRDALRSLI